MKRVKLFFRRSGCAAALTAALLASNAPGAVDHNPRSTGMANARHTAATHTEAAFHNPALLGMGRTPRSSVLVFPLTNYGLGIWSDKLRLYPYSELFTGDGVFGSRERFADFLSHTFRTSFGLDGKSPREVSDILSDKLKDGVKIYAGFRTPLFNLTWDYFSLDVTTRFDQQMLIPSAPFLIVFSEDGGLRKGTSLDFSTFDQSAVWATEFSFNTGLPVIIPELHKLFGLKYGAGGVGIRYIMGHSLLQAQAETGSIIYRDADNQLAIDGTIHIQSAGSGFSGNFNWSNPLSDGLPVSGHGIGADAAGILYNEKHALTIALRNVGALLWISDARETRVSIQTDNLDIYDIIDGINTADEDTASRDASLYIFDRNEGEYLSDERDSLVSTNGFVTLLPMMLSVGYSYGWNWRGAERPGIFGISDTLTVGVAYDQHLTAGPGCSFVPRIACGAENLMLGGVVPLRLGLVFGGPERIASTFGTGLRMDYASLQFGYKAVGTPVLWPRRGMELALGLNVNWGLTVDSDKDGIINSKDSCPREAEDKDGFEDRDGCPDPDNDGDGIPDTRDQCPDNAEDKDGFDDENGCPDFDNDGDYVLDSLDQCPEEAEDRDNFEDEDGCPDPDNDQDGILDVDDLCPVAAEDRDGHEDDDGCPEVDNDGDGIPDSVDSCPEIKESYNGYRDDDGCPDTLQKPSKKDEQALNKALMGVNFKTASAELTSTSYTHLNYVVNFLRRYPDLRYEIQGHTDSRGDDDYNLLLSAARAQAVYGYIAGQGIPSERLIAIGYGEQQPVAPNTFARGRALNRRVAFKIVQTNEEYERLRNLEEVFKERLQNAKIRRGRY